MNGERAHICRRPHGFRCLVPFIGLAGVDQQCLLIPEYLHSHVRPLSAQAINCNHGKKQNSAMCTGFSWILLYLRTEPILKMLSQILSQFPSYKHFTKWNALTVMRVSFSSASFQSHKANSLRIRIQVKLNSVLLFSMLCFSPPTSAPSPPSSASWQVY